MSVMFRHVVAVMSIRISASQASALWIGNWHAATVDIHLAAFIEVFEERIENIHRELWQVSDTAESIAIKHIE